MDLTSSTFSIPTAATPQLTAEQLAKRGQIEKSAKDFETSFLSVVLRQMF